MNTIPENVVLTGDCCTILPTLPAGYVDLVFADPPFNIGLDYPGYDDNRPSEEYLGFLRQVFVQARRVLTLTASLFVAIGAQYQAEVCVLLKELGFHWRNTLAWHYTFGPCQKRKFTPSWTPIHYFVVDPNKFTFNADAVKVPSARQLVYKDSRAKKGGKTPDDVWVLRPQDAPDCFCPDGDAWHIPRVAGTFRERQGHVCQRVFAIRRFGVEAIDRSLPTGRFPGFFTLDGPPEDPNRLETANCKHPLRCRWRCWSESFESPATKAISSSTRSPGPGRRWLRRGV
jgi:site-specific DNA-methyltransferase (adenine-specific)